MNLELAKYIINYFPNLMTKTERLGLMHLRNVSKLSNMEDDNSTWLNLFKKKGYLTTDKNALELIKDGYDVFCLNLGKRVINESSDRLYLNKCPKCNFLTETPQARQCKKCYHKWHEMRVAVFELNSSFQLHQSDFFLLGTVKRGEAKIGNFVDLTIIGINSKPEIIRIEYSIKNVDGNMTEEIGLGTNTLSDEDKAYLKKMGSYGGQMDIVNSK